MYMWVCVTDDEMQVLWSCSLLFPTDVHATILQYTCTIMSVNVQMSMDFSFGGSILLNVMVMTPCTERKIHTCTLPVSGEGKSRASDILIQFTCMIYWVLKTIQSLLHMQIYSLRSALINFPHLFRVRLHVTCMCSAGFELFNSYALLVSWGWGDFIYALLTVYKDWRLKRRFCQVSII